jgi:VanZ family protein
MPRHRSSAVPLAWLYVALIVYASLYPFSGWRLPGHSPVAFLIAPWWRWWSVSDAVFNLLGYMPLGMLVFGACVRSGVPPLRAFGYAVAAGTGLSLGMETLQNFLAKRIASNVDLGLNALGTALGAALAALVHRFGGVERWEAARDRWFIRRSAGGLALLLLWPVALLFPTSLPFGLGQVLGRVRDLLTLLLEDTAAASWLEGWGSPVASPTLGRGGELMLVALGLVAPSAIALSIALRGVHRVVLVLGAVALGIGVTTLSIALNFGPDHALAWITPQVTQAVALGTAAGALLSLAPRRVAAALGLMALTALIMLVARAPADPYYAQSLQAWEQGRFIRFHGAAQWVGWIWPYAAIAYLLWRVAAREEG